ncbi:MAG: HD domain-containing protein [Halanaerobiales bacterium]|nr:HD domain-containing protein [Halanaerobiales bacterium]
MAINYQAMLKYVKEKFENSERANKYPFRNRYKHTLRVKKWAERIQKIEGGNLEIIKIACIFHDVGWDEKVSHNIISKRIARDYLNKINYDNSKTKRVLEAIEHHCLRDVEKSLAMENYIVMDADLLDEVGAISIIWDAMASAYEDQPSYLKAYHRIKRFTLEIKEKQQQLKTATGKRYYQKKIEFIDGFIRELGHELLIE